MDKPQEIIQAIRSNACLTARDLWLSYDSSSFVLRGVNLDLEPGVITMILGPSGSGKTTLLKVLAGLLKPQRGFIHLTGALNGNGKGPRAGVAYIPQTLGLVRSMSALDNVLVGTLNRTSTLRALFKVFSHSALDEAKETLALMGLGNKIHEPVYNLSGGQRQRVAIARALVQHSKIILADEFVSQLDPITAESILELTHDIAREGVSFLITTHETDIVAKHADRVLVMNQGQVVHEARAPGLSEELMLEFLR